MSFIDTHPLVTVYIPTHNRLQLLKRAVDSVLKQDYQHLELIVVDDNSADETSAYLKQLSSRDTRVRFYSNDINLGACSSRNKAILNAKGDFITGLDDDDFFAENRISEFLKNWPSEKDVIGLYSETITKTTSGEFVSKNQPKKIFQKDLLIANHVGSQIFTKTCILKSLGGFNIKLNAWQDLECWYRLLSIPNSRMTKVSVPTYVIDQSHPHERISNSGLGKITNACDLFIATHNLKEQEAMILRLQILSYSPNSIGVKHIVKCLIGTMSLQAAKQMIKVYLSPYTRAIKSKIYTWKKYGKPRQSK